MKIYHENEAESCCIERKKFESWFLHWHKRVEIILIEEGECGFLIDTKSYTARQGDIIFINSCVLHQFVPTGNYCTVCVNQFSKSILLANRINFMEIPVHISAEELREKKIFSNVMNIFKNSEEEYSLKLENYESMLNSNNTILYNLLGRHFTKNTDDTIRDIHKLHQLQKIADYIEQNYNQDISLESISKIFNYSPSNISMLFSKHFNINYRDYLNNIRIYNATGILVTTGKSCSEVAMECGFPTIRTFNNVFKKHVGCTPVEYRKKSQL